MFCNNLFHVNSITAHVILITTHVIPRTVHVIPRTVHVNCCIIKDPIRINPPTKHIFQQSFRPTWGEAGGPKQLC